MRIHCITTMVLALGLSACGPEDQTVPPASFETEGWIDTAPPSEPGPRPGQAGGEEDEGDEDDEDDEGGEESGRYWGVFMPADGPDGGAEGEFFAEENGVEVCLLVFDLAASEPSLPCEACSSAWSLTASNPSTEIDEDGACERLLPEPLEGLVLHLGIDGNNVLYRDSGEGWGEIGEAGFEEGEMWLEWEDGVD